MAASPPEGHPTIDWTKWEPAGEGDGIKSSLHSFLNLSIVIELRDIELTSPSPLTMSNDQRPRKPPHPSTLRQRDH